MVIHTLLVADDVDVDRTIPREVPLPLRHCVQLVDIHLETTLNHLFKVGQRLFKQFFALRSEGGVNHLLQGIWIGVYLAIFTRSGIVFKGAFQLILK